MSFIQAKSLQFFVKLARISDFKQKEISQKLSDVVYVGALQGGVKIHTKVFNTYYIACKSVEKRKHSFILERILENL